MFWIKNKKKGIPLQYPVIYIYIYICIYISRVQGGIQSTCVDVGASRTWISVGYASLQHGFGYNTDQCWISIGHFRLFLPYVFTFYSPYNTNWIANTGIGLDHNNSVIKRLWCLDARC